jgi:hypothetical protein
MCVCVLNCFPGLRELTLLCSEGEAIARERLIHQIEETGYLGCIANW